MCDLIINKETTLPCILMILNSNIYLGGSVGKKSTCNSGDLNSISWSERFPAEGNGNSLQFSCLGNPMNRGIWSATVMESQVLDKAWRIDSQFKQIITNESTSTLSKWHWCSLDKDEQNALATYKWCTGSQFMCICKNTHKHIHIQGPWYTRMLLRKLFEWEPEAKVVTHCIMNFSILATSLGDSI